MPPRLPLRAAMPCLALVALLLASCKGISSNSTTTAPFDFTAGTLTCSPANPVVGQSLAITTTVSNTGGYGAPAIPWTAYRDGTVAVDSGTITRLYGGSSQQLVFHDATSPVSGVHSYVLKLDPTGSLGDNAANNDSLPLSVTVSDFDLTASMVVTPAGVALNATGPIVVTVVITNNGPTAISGRSIPCSIIDTAGLLVTGSGYTIDNSPNCTFTASSDPLVASTLVSTLTASGSLAPGASTSMFLIITPPSNTWSSSISDGLTFTIDPAATFLNASATPSVDAAFAVPGSG